MLGGDMQEWAASGGSKMAVLEKENAELKAYIAREWAPISEAPKDGTQILVYNGQSGYCTGAGDIGCAVWEPEYYSCGQKRSFWGWMSTACCDGVTRFEPTHFQFLPKPPTE